MVLLPEALLHERTWAPVPEGDSRLPVACIQEKKKGITQPSYRVLIAGTNGSMEQMVPGVPPEQDTEKMTGYSLRYQRLQRTLFT